MIAKRAQTALPRRQLEIIISEDHDGAHLWARAVGFRAVRIIRNRPEGRDSYRFRYQGIYLKDQ